MFGGVMNNELKSTFTKLLEENELAPWRGFKIFPWNKPLSKPGAYLLLDLVDLKPYIGISKNLFSRIPLHPVGCPKLEKGFETVGRHSFLVFPFIYSVTENPSWLSFFELELMTIYDSVVHGYNIKSTISSLFRPEDFSNYMRELHKTPEMKEKVQKHLKEMWSSQEARDLYGQLISKLKWITNGVENQRVPSEFVLRPGWRYGVTRMWVDRRAIACRPGAREAASIKTKLHYERNKKIRAFEFRVCYNCFASFMPQSTLEQVTCSRSCNSSINSKVYGNGRWRKQKEVLCLK